jgi:hypothetical protein
MRECVKGLSTLSTYVQMASLARPDILVLSVYVANISTLFSIRAP